MKNKQIPYSDSELFDVGPPPVYTGRQLDEIAFPLGGIGAGTIFLGGWGQLRDFEIFNRPEKGLQFAYTFFTLYAKRGDEEPVTRVVQGPVGGVNFTGRGSGVDRMNGAGLPHLRECRFTGAFPMARLDFTDARMPLNAAMEAFNPFIPLNDKDSSLPVAIFLFHLENPGDQPVKATLFANLENRTGHPESGGGVIAYKSGENVAGLDMRTKKHDPESPRYGTLALTTTWKDLNIRTHWLRGGWFDALHDFWDAASQHGELPENREPAEASADRNDVGSIGLKVTLAPGEKATLPIFITWHHPNFEKYWGNRAVWKNYYATLFSDAFDVAEYVGENLSRLDRETRLFKDSLFESTLPAPVMDAVSSQISILKTHTCLRLTDGTFYAFEGCNSNTGCCEGTCTHVWNYAQALPYLYPNLERSIRDADYAYNMTGEGRMTFRMPLPLGTIAAGQFHAAGDGQLGGVMKVYREWLISGDDAWLRKVWPQTRRALEFAWQGWDKDKDGVMEGVQHNTYDIEFIGPNTMMGSFYLGALRAGEEMARYLGDDASANEYRRLFESGKKWMNENLFNGEFYRQEVRTPEGKILADPKEFPRYQYGDGCLSDQMIGQWYARMLGLGDLFDPENVKKTMASIFKYNWKADLSEHANPQRIYALNDEQGLLLCSWPRGGRPPLPFVYSDEVWCGIEYQVASHLIYEGFIEEGLAVVKGVRDRHDGVRRNPWDEFECGHHYSRSMASYAVLLALSGFHYNAAAKQLAFKPCIHEKDFSCFFSVDSGWGVYRQRIRHNVAWTEIEARYGTLELRQIGVPIGGAVNAMLNRRAVPATREGDVISFAEPVRISAGETLTLLL
jgi:uncharacterized protein (DUF608 family)